MAFFDSQVSKFLINNLADAEQDISPYITGIDGLPGPRELNEATTLNQAGAKWHPTLERVTITLDLLYSVDTLVGTDTVLGPLRTHTAARAFKYGPHGSGGGAIKYSGVAWVRNYVIVTRVGSILTARCELNVDGVVGRGTF